MMSVSFSTIVFAMEKEQNANRPINLDKQYLCHLFINGVLLPTIVLSMEQKNEETEDRSYRDENKLRQAYKDNKNDEKIIDQKRLNDTLERLRQHKLAELYERRQLDNLNQDERKLAELFDKHQLDDLNENQLSLLDQYQSKNKHASDDMYTQVLKLFTEKYKPQTAHTPPKLNDIELQKNNKKYSPNKTDAKTTRFIQSFNKNNNPVSPDYEKYAIVPLTMLSPKDQHPPIKELYALMGSHLIFNTLQSNYNKLSPRDKLIHNIESKLRIMKAASDNQELIKDQSVNEIKQLWNQLKALYNYNLLDKYIYPSHPFVNTEELNKIRKKKPLTTLLHEDKYAGKNQTIMKSLFQQFEDFSRPEKYLDFIVNPIVDVLTPVITQMGFLAIAYATDLPSKFFPNHFKSEYVLSFEKGTDSEKIEIKKAILKKEQYSNVITNHDIAIKKKNLIIAKKQQSIRNALKSFSTHNSFKN